MKWVSCHEGTRTLPHTWQMVVKAVKDTRDGVLAEDLAHEQECIGHSDNVT